VPVRSYYGRFRRRYTAELVTTRYDQRLHRLDPGGPGADATLAITATLTAGGAVTVSRTPPTFPLSDDLAEGTGTRAHGSLTTTAGDWLVVEIIAENGVTPGSTITPTCPGLTFTAQNDISGAILTDDVRIRQFSAPDAAGGARIVTLTPGGGALNYRSRLTAVRGSEGPGTGKGTSATGQTVSVARQRDHSAAFMAVGDWSTGAVGAPAWTPDGATVASQQGIAGTYIFGRWDDTGTLATASHGITSPSYTTPSVAVLEFLGATVGAKAADSTLAVTATLTTAADRTAVAGASITGTATLTTAADRAAMAAATLAVTITLTTALTKAISASATLAGTATLTGAADRTAVASATLAATATLTTVLAESGITAATLAGTATLTAGAAIGAAPTSIDANLSVTATLTAAGARTASASAALGITATLTASATQARAGAATLAVVASLTTTLAGPVSIAGTVAGVATLTAAMTLFSAAGPPFVLLESALTVSTTDQGRTSATNGRESTLITGSARESLTSASGMRE